MPTENTEIQEELPISVVIEPEVVEGKQEEVAKAVPDPAVEELKAQNEAIQKAKQASDERAASERAAREQAERRATEAEKQVATSKVETIEQQAETINMGLESAKAEAKSAKGAYAHAMEAGDFNAAADAQERIAVAAAKIQRLDEARDYVERQVERAKQAPLEAEQVQRRAPADPVEAYVANRSEPTKDWLLAHKDYITDPRKNLRLNAAHMVAVDEDLAPDTPEYFARVEKYLGLNKSTQEQTVNTPRRQSAPVAPVNAGSGMDNGIQTNDGGTVKLTRGEAAAAQDGTHVWNYSDPKGKFKKGDPIGIQEMARRKLALTKQGAYDKSYTDQ
jgi:hypothetical protein